MAEAKYLWTDKSFDAWVKEQKKLAEKVGINTSTSKVTKVLMKRVILPNNITLFDKPKKIRIKLR